VRRSSDDAEQDIGYDANGEDLDIFGLLAFVGAQNLIFPSEDFGGASWTAQTGITATSNTSETTDPLGGSGAAKIVSTDATKGFFISGLSFPTSSDLVRSIYLKGAVGGETAVLKDPSGYGGSTAVTLTTEWQRFNHSTSAGITDAQGIFVDDISVGTIYAFGAQCNEGTTIATYNKTTTDIGGDGAVTTWYDQTGNGNHATNSTASEQSKIVDGGSIIYEGATISRPAIQFDGVDDHFDISNFTGVPTISQFNVLKPSATNVDETFTSIQNDTTTDGIFLGQGNLGTEAKFGLRNFQGADIADSGIAMTLQQYLLAGITTSTTAQIYANGVAGAISAKARGNVNGDTQIGANGGGANSFSGKFQEIIIFESDQSANRTGIEGNIDNYFRITS
jgi:hypothetical protein